MVWKKTYDRTVVFVILAFPLVGLLRRRLYSDRGRRRYGLVVRSGPIRHNSTDPEDGKRGKESVKEGGWRLDQNFRAGFLSSPPSGGTINGDCRIFRVDPDTVYHDFHDERRVTQTRSASRQEPWLYSERIVPRCDVLAVWETHRSLE